MKALWGCVPQSLRAFSAEISDKVIHVRSIFDESVNDNDKELLSDAAGEIIADYPDDFIIKEEIVTIPKDNKMEHLKELIFLRNEL